MSDDGGRDWARTRTSDATAPPPARAQAAREAAAQRTPGPAPAPAAPAADEPPAPRSSLLVQALLPAVVGGVLAGAAAAGTLPLALVVVALQAVVVVAVLGLLDAPAIGGAAAVAWLAAAAADAVVLHDDGRLDRLAEVAGLALVASLLHQLVRRSRSRVTESMAATSSAVLAAVSASCLLAVQVQDREGTGLPAVLVAAAAALLVGRLVDRLVPRAVVAAGTTRTWPGLLAAAVVGAGAALLVSTADGAGPTGGPVVAALLALAAVAAVVLVDVALDLAAGELRAGSRDARRVAALLPARALLPYALLGPVAALTLTAPVG